LGEHQLDKLGVTGSSPVPPIIESPANAGLSFTQLATARGDVRKMSASACEERPHLSVRAHDHFKRGWPSEGPGLVARHVGSLVLCARELLLMIALPGPSVPISRSPSALVAELSETERKLAPAIERWQKSKSPPSAVTVLARREQLIVRLVATNRVLTGKVIRLDPAITDDVVAQRDLAELTASGPAPRSRLIRGRPAAAAALIRWYREAQARFGVRWQLLAAINFVETAFNKVRNASGAGAEGPMQFEPATWKSYGLGGNINDPHDAILGAANYLVAHHYKTDERGAVYDYNPSPLYVDAVMRYARQISQDPNDFFAYYTWQVYFRKRTG
jgi:membrane-bound lytic murein transglycosylase B